jgi:hypothetical protein
MGSEAFRLIRAIVPKRDPDANSLLVGAALGIKIEEDIMLPTPTFAGQPRLQRERPIVVSARMADEKA